MKKGKRHIRWRIRFCSCGSSVHLATALISIMQDTKMKLRNYRFGFDFWGMQLFLLVMLPNFIWFTLCHLIFGVVNFVG